MKPLKSEHNILITTGVTIHMARRVAGGLLSVTVSSNERTFSKFKFINNYLKNILHQKSPRKNSLLK